MAHRKLIDRVTDLNLLRRLHEMLTSHNCKRVTVERVGLKLIVTDSPDDLRRLERRIRELEQK